MKAASFSRRSFIELNARERAKTLLDEGSFEELLGPFDRLKSPWLVAQGVVPQSDDGLVVTRGAIDGNRTIILAIEGKFQGGSIGEVSGAKIACALDLARQDNEAGQRTCAILLLETGGVRLQEANLGLAAIGEIQSSIVALRRHVPVIGVVAGMVGCFGGMGISAGLCSYLIVTREARLGLNGPEVIEQEAGIEEFDSTDRQLIWSATGGQRRYETGFADYLVEDDVAAIGAAVRTAFKTGLPPIHRSAEVEKHLRSLEEVDPAVHAEAAAKARTANKTASARAARSRGQIWFEALAGAPNESPGTVRSVLAGDALLGKDLVRYLAIVPYPQNRFPRARSGEAGLEEGWTLAKFIREVIDEGKRRPIIAIVDVPSQAYGRREEEFGIFLACAAAANAYADARLAGHPVISLIVGRAFSGGFLAHGHQSNRILAFDDSRVVVHAMGKQAAARVTKRSVSELDELAGKVLPLSYDIRAYARLGTLHELIRGVIPEAPAATDIAKVREALERAIADARSGPRDLSSRLNNPEAQQTRTASIKVRQLLTSQWGNPGRSDRELKRCGPIIIPDHINEK
jgi:malonate decarboxylase beta subunit